MRASRRASAEAKASTAPHVRRRQGDRRPGTRTDEKSDRREQRQHDDRVSLAKQPRRLDARWRLVLGAGGTERRARPGRWEASLLARRIVGPRCGGDHT